MKKRVITIQDLMEFQTIETGKIKMLPACHTSDINKLYSHILQDNKLIAKEKCKIYNEYLIYFFYGKAKYIPISELKDCYSNNPPFTLIYDLNRLLMPKRIVCFDSGGFDLFEIEKVNRDHFEIHISHLDDIKKLVYLLYGDNTNYLNSTFQFSYDPKEFTFCQAFRELMRIGRDVASKERPLKYGERVFTIELQYEMNEIDLVPDTVVFPISELSSDSGIQDWRDLFNGANIESYNDNTAQGHSYYIMSDKVKEKISEIA